MATFLPFNPRSMLSAVERMCSGWVSLTFRVASRSEASTPISCANLIKALMSLGKHEPPKPGPASMKRVPILLSRPIPRATESTCPCGIFSQIRATVLMKLTFIARNALLAYFISSAISGVVSTTGGIIPSP